MLDIRMPIAAMFAALGALLTVYGLMTFTNKEMYERSLGVNINLWWGLVMIAFGGIMVWLARRGTSSVRSADESVQGRRTESANIRQDWNAKSGRADTSFSRRMKC